MFVHIGDRKVISDNSLIGIFNFETLQKSIENKNIISHLKDDTKTVVVLKNNNIEFSTVSSFTVLSRYGKINDYYWRKG